MTLYRFGSDKLQKVAEASFGDEGILERDDLQRLLKRQIEVLSDDLFVLTEEFGNWEDSKRRIDLLCIDSEARLVVVELKRSEDGGFMDLQAIRYAAMISTMTFEQAVEAHTAYLRRENIEEDARERIVAFLGWDESEGESFAPDVQIVLVSRDFSRELTTSVLWLNDKGLDVRCVKLRLYKDDGRLLVDKQQIIPLPEAEDFQIRLRRKDEEDRLQRASNADFTRYDVTVYGETHLNQWKRNAIFLVCKALCDHGIDPERFSEIFDWRPTRVWFTIPGEVAWTDFVSEARHVATQRGTNFSAGRWNWKEPINANGKTYAFSNQWGGISWLRAMEKLKTEFSDAKIEFKPTM